MKEFSIVLLIIHPNIDPELVSSTLRMKPFRCWKAGDSRATPTGAMLDGVWSDTRWNYVVDYQDDSICIFDKVAELVNYLAPHKKFLSRIRTEGGSAEIIMHVPGDTHIGDSAEPTLLHRMAELGLSLGIEVFPEWARRS
jgi:hypothetical protein